MLFLVRQIPSGFVDALCASWRLPPLAAVSISVYGVIPFQRIEKRNGSLDLFKAAICRFLIWV